MKEKGKVPFDTGENRHKFELSMAREEGYAAGLRDGGYAKQTILDKFARLP